MSIKYIKVKIKSLAVEAKIIRHEEHAAKQQSRFLKAIGSPEAEYAAARKLFWGLRDHRTIDVRTEARASLIAYGFLRGKRYRQIECSSKVILGTTTTKDGIATHHLTTEFYHVMVRAATLIIKYGPKQYDKREDLHKELEAWITCEM